MTPHKREDYKLSAVKYYLTEDKTCTKFVRVKQGLYFPIFYLSNLYE